MNDDVDDDINDDVAGAAVEHPPADPHDAGRGEGQVQHDLAAAPDEAAAVDGPAAAGPARPHPEHADPDQQECGAGTDRK